MEDKAAVIEFDDVSFSWDGSVPILDRLTFAVNGGETLVLLGRSGSGKTTALKLMNGLLAPSKGAVRVENRATTEWNPVELRRRMGYAIQEVALFPHFTVGRNIALVPTLQRWPAERIRRRVKELLQLVELDEELESRYPRELSGGQRQRVGVARALAADPPVLLMDEPFGALDPITRAEVQQGFRKLQSRLKKTVVFVTHDLREALLLADRIALVEQGKLEGIFARQEFLHTQNVFAARYRAAFELEI